MTETLSDLLMDRGIRLKTQRPGSTQKTPCPKCGGGKTREVSLSVSIDQDGGGFTLMCHRGSCGWTDGARLNPEDGTTRRAPPAEERVVKAPPAPKLADVSRPAALYNFFEKRGISKETVDLFGCYVTRRWFPVHGEQPAIVFPYTVNRVAVNRKYRPPQKNPMMQEKDALPSLFNVDAIESTDVVWWCEGEPDVMAMHEAGYPQTVTLPNGAGAELRDEDDPRREDDKRFLPLATHAELLAKVQKFVLAGDSDKPGLVLREELARRLGRHRIWLVTWPEGCKDANDTLIKHGKEGVVRAVEAAEPYPISGVQRLKGDTLLTLRHQPPPKVMTTGVGCLDKVLKLPGEGRLIVVTGIPSHGKSAFTRWLMVHTMEHHDRKWQIFSPEMQPWETFAASMAEVLTGKSFWPNRAAEQMTDQDISFAENWLRKRCNFLASDAENEVPSLDWLLERGALSVQRDGTTDVLWDPWNEVEHDYTGLTETQYTGRALQRSKAFAYRYGVNVWIVAHPLKLLPPKPGAQIGAPGLYDISGGANWANKIDLGLTVHTPSGQNTQIHLRKARFSRWGVRNAVAEIAFNPANGRYSTPLGDDLPGID